MCAVEVVDEGAFHLEHMIQVIYRDSSDAPNTLYLQAQVGSLAYRKGWVEVDDAGHISRLNRFTQYVILASSGRFIGIQEGVGRG